MKFKQREYIQFFYWVKQRIVSFCIFSGLCCVQISCNSVTVSSLSSGSSDALQRSKLHAKSSQPIKAKVKKPNEISRVSDSKIESFSPAYHVEEGLILPTEKFIYEGQRNTADIVRFEGLNAPNAYSSGTLSPARLENMPQLTMARNGGFVSPSGDLFEELTPFPWPPPKPSTSFTFDNDQVGFTSDGKTSLGKVDRIVTAGLRELNYGGRAYFGVPGGYALVTQLEQIERNGKPVEGERRWQLALPGQYDFWTARFWTNLLTGSKGYFRVFVLVVTDKSMGGKREEVTAKQAMDWLESGKDRLPSHIAKIPYGVNHRVSCLVYEFERRDIDNDIKGPVGPPSRLSAIKHLKGAGILSVIENKR